MKNEGFFKINIPLALIGAVIVSTCTYYCAGAITPGADLYTMENKLKYIIYHPFHWYLNKYTLPLMFSFLLFYILFVIYQGVAKKDFMHGKEYGESKFEDNAYVNSKLADLNNDPNDPRNIVVYTEKRRWFKFGAKKKG